MQLKVREFRPRIGPVEYRVVQPWEPLRHTALGNPDGYGCLIGDFAAGRGLREENVPKGHSVLVSMLSWELRPDPSVHRMQFDICFKAHPPYEHFRRPGRRLPAA
ncbi:hypothetical protein G3I60_32645 [Streptomyces sp. SID13666]|nr:hypothetical protein [Streptomyces sp. SID13666]NEA70079.1 hypothetical protein [Streptomyces sp. SID13588]